METKITPELHLQLDQYDDATQVLDALVFGPYLEGTLPWVRWVQLHQVKADAPLLPAGVTATRVAVAPTLLHGPPGTGKTTALRALAHAWKDWCRLDCVIDPERLLESPGYLMAVALGNDDADDASRWRLLLLEDCDELIRGDAKRGSGQSLSRLLNLTDGLLGQGLEVIVGITTNEPLTKLHPAIVRPGRCIAHIEVGRFNRIEALDWLGRPAAIDADGVTLAELFVLRGELTTVENTAPAQPAGMYL